MKKIIILLMILVLTMSVGVSNALANSELENTLMPRLSYISASDATLSINGSTATVHCWVKGNVNDATKAKIIAELQLKNSDTNWIPVAIWTDTQNDYEARVYETKTINQNNTYRVKATATVWEGSQSETVTFYAD